jgi:hypothetical protein
MQNECGNRVRLGVTCLLYVTVTLYVFILFFSESIVLKNTEIRPVALTRGSEIIVWRSLQFQVPSVCSNSRVSVCGSLGAVVCTVPVCLGYDTLRKHIRRMNLIFSLWGNPEFYLCNVIIILFCISVSAVFGIVVYYILEEFVLKVVFVSKCHLQVCRQCIVVLPEQCCAEAFVTTRCPFSVNVLPLVIKWKNLKRRMLSVSVL